MAELVRVDRRKGYHDVGRHPEGRRIPGLVIARFDAPLFFANGAAFGTFVRRLATDSPSPMRWVILAAGPITDVDTTAAEELAALDDHLSARGIRLVFAELKGPVKDGWPATASANGSPQAASFPRSGPLCLPTAPPPEPLGSTGPTATRASRVDGHLALPDRTDLGRTGSGPSALSIDGLAAQTDWGL